MCKRTSGLSAPIHEWLKQEDEWSRRILRKCTECNKFVIQPIIYVDGEYPFCMQCLSHKVQVSLAGGEMSFVCNDCGFTTQFLDELTEVEANGK